MKNKEIIISILLLLVGLGAGFFAGSRYTSTQRNQRFAQFQNGQFPEGRFGNGANNGNNQFRGRMGGNQVAGEIISSDDKSITVKLPDGSSKIVMLNSSTKIVKSSDASASDLKTGENVAVFGTTNSDGSVTAQNVQLNPAFRGQTPQATSSPQK